MSLSQFTDEETEAQWGWIVQDYMVNKWLSQDSNPALSWLKFEPLTIKMHFEVLFVQSPLPVAARWPQTPCH